MDDVKNYCPKCQLELDVDSAYMSGGILRCRKDNAILEFKKEEITMKTDEKQDKVQKVINFVKGTLKVTDEKAARSIVGKAYTTMTQELKKSK